jgi:hypothetical protein
MDQATRIARNVAKCYAEIVENDRMVIGLFAVLALEGSYVRAHYDLATLIFIWFEIVAYWCLKNGPKSRRLL